MSLRQEIVTSFVFLFLISAAARTTIVAQTMQGVIQDEQGAVIPGVEVTIRNVETGISRTLVSDEEGRYRSTNLNLGTYEVRAELAGFQTAVRRGITLTIGQVAVIDLPLKVGEVSEQVVVTGEAPLVETTQSSIAALVDERTIRDLPLNVRSYAELATLQIGVTKLRGGGSASNGVGVQLSFGGSRQDANTYMLDGSDIVNPYNKPPNSGTGGVLGVESVREFQVLTNTYSAQYGRGMGGQLNAATRSGTNEFHGSVYEFLRNDNLDASNFFDRFDVASGKKVKPEFKRNQFGFAIGGPIRKDKTFFFGNYEGFRERLGLTNIVTVLDENAKLGILPGRAQITVNPAVKPYLANPIFHPVANGRNFGNGTAEYIFTQTQPVEENVYVVRVDQNFSERDSMFVRNATNKGSRLEPGARADFGRDQVGVANYFTTVEEKHIFSPKVLNVFRYSVNRQVFSIVIPQNTSIPSNLYFTNQLQPPLEPMGSVSITGGGGFGGNNFRPRQYFLNLFEWSDDITYSAGRHSLKFGGVAKRIQYNFRMQNRVTGTYAFANVAAYLAGTPREFRVQIPGADGYRGVRQNLFGFYIQDDYQMLSNLTWNLGLRYEFITVPTEVNGKVANLHNILDSQTTVGDPFFENPSMTNFAPRIGFAWDPFRDGKTSIRGGFGIYFDQILYTYWNHPYANQPPFYKVAIVSPTARFPDAFQGILSATRFDLAPETVQGKFTNPYLQQWNLTVQRELFRQTAVSVGYMGSGGRHLGRIVDNVAYSEIAVDGRRFVPVSNWDRRRNPNFGEVRQRTMDANSFYHALAIAFKKRYADGFDSQVSYTFSKSIDDASGKIGAAETPNQSQWSLIPEDPSFDRGLSLQHVSHLLSFNMTWEFPFGPGKRFGAGVAPFWGKVLGGWTMTSIVSLDSGSPGNIEIDTNIARDGRAAGNGLRPDLRPGSSNNPVLGGPDRYYDPSAFVAPQEGFYGNLGRSTLIGPGVAIWDFSLAKSTKVSSISEDFNIQFRAELFNALNRPNFGFPSRTAFAGLGEPLPNAGRITDTSTSARQVQFALKLLW